MEAEPPLMVEGLFSFTYNPSVSHSFDSSLPRKEPVFIPSSSRSDFTQALLQPSSERKVAFSQENDERSLRKRKFKGFMKTRSPSPDFVRSSLPDGALLSFVAKRFHPSFTWISSQRDFIHLGGFHLSSNAEGNS